MELAISPISFQSCRMEVTVTHGYYPVRLQRFLISHCMLVKFLSGTILGLMCINVSLFIEFAAIKPVLLISSCGYFPLINQ